MHSSLSWLHILGPAQTSHPSSMTSPIGYSEIGPFSNQSFLSWEEGGVGDDRSGVESC